MSALSNKHYFNYGGQGPLPSPSLKAMKASWEKVQELGPFTLNVWPYLANEIQQTKIKLAKICGVRPERISLTENVTSGCILPLWGLPFEAGDRILISNCEHPGIVAACMELARRLGLEIDTLDLEVFASLCKKPDEINDELLESLEKSIKPKTKLIVISHILWNTGQVIPIEAIAMSLNQKPQKPYLLVDGAQSFGQIPLKRSAASADIYAFTGHKWACGPEGLGGVVLSERILNEASPTFIGWRTLKNENLIQEDIGNLFHNDGRRFEIATSCIPLLAGLRSSLDLIEEECSEEVRIQQICLLSNQFWEYINDSDCFSTILKIRPNSGLVSFTSKDNKSPAKLTSLLGKKKIWIRSLESPLCMRACFHITTTAQEIEKLIECLTRYTNHS